MRHLIAAAAWLLLSATAACAWPAHTYTAPPTPPAGQVTVSGTTLKRDGVTWVPKGAITVWNNAPCEPQNAASVGVAASLSPSTKCLLNSSALTAYPLWGASEITAMKAAGLDTVRFNVSQSGIDQSIHPAGDTNYIYDPYYLAAVCQAIHYVRSQGMNVIVDVQWEGPAGDPTSVGVVKQTTLDAWAALTPCVRGDNGILLDLLNEPDLSTAQTPPAADWYGWGVGPMSFQTIINQLRGAGVTNPIILEGLAGAQTFAGLPAADIPTDPLNQLIFSVHVFPQAVADGAAFDTYQSTDWDTLFGNFCATNACLVTAFFTGGASNCFAVGDPTGTDSPHITFNLLTYLQSKGIGLVVFAWDLSSRFNQSMNPWTLSNFSGFSACGTNAEGPGAMLADYFLNGTIAIQ